MVPPIEPASALVQQQAKPTARELLATESWSSRWTSPLPGATATARANIEQGLEHRMTSASCVPSHRSGQAIHGQPGPGRGSQGLAHLQAPAQRRPHGHSTPRSRHRANTATAESATCLTKVMYSRLGWAHPASGQEAREMGIDWAGWEWFAWQLLWWPARVGRLWPRCRDSYGLTPAGGRCRDQ